MPKPRSGYRGKKQRTETSRPVVRAGLVFPSFVSCRAPYGRSIDADLQDDIGAIRDMIDRFHDGAEIVYGIRHKRENDSFFKRITASYFYRIMRALGAESVHNHADYRLMSRRAIESLKQYREVNLYLRGIIPLLGFRSEVVYYTRATRFAG